ncbi:hypothetical protein F5Y11DRAFT_354497 [Daldinia sp. FL1419]|nr:hypothetical protein F5Y11DRAFT_354497 [Daldinia sp. FL1419]
MSSAGSENRPHVQIHREAFRGQDHDRLRLTEWLFGFRHNFLPLTTHDGEFFVLLLTALFICFSVGTARDSTSTLWATRPVNTLRQFKHYGAGCDISSSDLYLPIGSVCPDKNLMLTAMSSGGRIGKDAPYITRGCDMRWFSSWEACEILGRFSQVILVGDSMLRHVIGALNILIREDVGYGGVTNWNFNEEENRKCFCNRQFDVRDCSVQGIFSTADVIKHDPVSLTCPRRIPEWNTDLRIEQIVRFPIPEEEHQRLEKAIDPNPLQRKAFILGHGLWNNLEIDQAVNWLDLVLDTIESKTMTGTRRWNPNSRRNMPVLLMTPNAAGDKKPDEWMVSQGNKALVKFEHEMANQAAKRRIDHLGTWNMSIQATLYDGVHMDMRGNLLKAQMVLNWLDLLDR